MAAFTFFILVATVFMVAVYDLTFESILANYPVGVLFILLSLDIFSQCLLKTRALERLGINLSGWTKGNKAGILILCGLGMFITSAFLNNLAALFVLFPIMATLFDALRLNANQRVICLALVISTCNLGGAATPIGDLPAILLMNTGAITFGDYFIRAFPVFLLTTAIIVGSYYLYFKKGFRHADDAELQQAKMGILALEEDYRFVRIKTVQLAPCILVFGGMVVAWIYLDPTVWPFHYTAVSGLFLIMAFCPKAVRNSVLSGYDLRALIATSQVLFVGALVAASPILDDISRFLLNEINDPVWLLFAMSCLICIASGLFQAGPAAAVVLPMVVDLEQTQLSVFGPWVYVAYAASICAGSSMFLWSATAGIALSGEANKVGLTFNWYSYLKFGLWNAAMQFVIAVVLIGVFVEYFSIHALWWLLVLFLPKFLIDKKIGFNNVNKGAEQSLIRGSFKDG